MPIIKPIGKILTDKLDFFTDQINYIRQSSIGTPKRLYIDLSVLHNDLDIGVAGNFFYIFQTSGTTENLDIKVNEQREPAFNYSRRKGLLTPFYRLFITNVAQPGGWAIILYGTQAPDFLQVLDNTSEIDEVLGELQGDLTPEGMAVVAVNAAATQIVAANANRKSLIVTHRHDGVGFIDIGYTNAVTALVHIVRLAPDESYIVDDYRGAIWGIRSGAATNAVYGEV